MVASKTMIVLPNAIFVHVHKTGGMAITAALKRSGNFVQFTPDTLEYHGKVRRFAMELRRALGEQIWRSRFTFAFVRNPYDLMVSVYSMLQQSTRHHIKELAAAVESVTNISISRLSFSDFVSCVADGVVDNRWDYHWKPQYLHLTDATGDIIVDYVGRFERLACEWPLIASCFGYSEKLARRNATCHRPYFEYYTDALRDIVTSLFRVDIHMFGYLFEY